MNNTQHLVHRAPDRGRGLAGRHRMGGRHRQRAARGASGDAMSGGRLGSAGGWLAVGALVALTLPAGQLLGHVAQQRLPELPHGARRQAQVAVGWY